MKWPKNTHVVQTECSGSVSLNAGTPWADDADVVRERPDLFGDEPTVPLAGERPRPVENARNVPGGGGRITGVRRAGR